MPKKYDSEEMQERIKKSASKRADIRSDLNATKELRKEIAELKPLIKELVEQYVEPYDTVEIKNPTENVSVLNINKVVEAVESAAERTERALNAKKPVDTVTVKNFAEIKRGLVDIYEVIKNNRPIVNVEKQNLEMPRRAQDAIAVRLSDGKKFYKAITTFSQNMPVSRLDETLTDATPTMNTKTVTHAIQPDGDYLPQKADGTFFDTSVNLAADAAFTSDWTDHDGYGMIELFFSATVPSANKGIAVEWTDDVQAATPTVRTTSFYEFNEASVRKSSLDLHLRPKLDGFRIKYTNGGQAQTAVFIEAIGRVSPEVGFENSGNAVVTADFAREVALGNVSNYSQNTKFGRNQDIDGGPEDVISGGGTYTGFNATGNENMTTSSTSTADAGSLVSSGTVTTTGEAKIIDSTATFVSDGVAVGDIVMNDTRGTHGYVTSVDSETQVTVFQMTNGQLGTFANIETNSYRIATTSGTGAAVVEWTRILNEDYEKQTNVYVIMNGTTDVTTTVDAFRCTRGRVLLAGSGGANAGNISVTQETTTAVVFAEIPKGFHQSLILADTVPKDEVYLIENVQLALTVAGGGDASGVASLRVRNFGGVFRAERVFDMSSTGGTFNDEEIGGIVLGQATDFKIRVDSVSANNVRVGGKIEYLEIDEV